MVQHPSKRAKPQWGAPTLPLPGWHEGPSMLCCQRSPHWEPGIPHPHRIIKCCSPSPWGWGQGFHQFPAVGHTFRCQQRPLGKQPQGSPAPLSQGGISRSLDHPPLGYPQRLTEDPGLLTPPSSDEVLSPFPCQPADAESHNKIQSVL